MIIGEGLKLSLTGLVLGLVGALWLGRVGSSLLFGVAATDPATFVLSSLLLTAVAVQRRAISRSPCGTRRSTRGAQI